MRVHAPTLERTSHADTLSASVDDLRLWFRAPPGMLPTLRVEPFVVIGLVGAMALGEALEVAPEVPVSPRLLKGLDTIQDILHLWLPALHKIEVRATPGAASKPQPGTAVFFSGGVDAIYSFLKHEDEITHLVAIHGLDVPVREEQLFSSVEAQGRAFADRFGKLLVPVGTNSRDFADKYRLGATLFHGAILASTALALGFGRNFVGSSDTYRDLVPWGSHPLLDPLWSTEATELIHDGCEADRAGKLRRIAIRPQALTSLRVCCQNTGETNCGSCEKCLRTMMALRLLGEAVPTLPALTSVGPVRRLRIKTSDDLLLFTDNLRLARAKGDREAVRALESCVWRYEVRELFRTVDRLFLGNLAHRSYRAYKRLRHGPEEAWIELLPH